MKYFKLIALLLVCLFLAACAAETGSMVAYQGQSAEQILQTGERALVKKNYNEAVTAFEALDALYPFGDHAKTAQLRIIDAYYGKEDYAGGVAAADRYIHLYPRDKNVDYAYYMRGMINLQSGKSWIAKLYPIDLAERDLTAMRAAYIDFRDIVKLYPKGKYAKSAQQKILYIRKTLARHELEVARFYLKRKAYVAAANRADQVVKHYKDTPYYKDALKVMAKAYHRLGAVEQAGRAEKMLKAQ